MTWLEREDSPPDVAPLADQDERVMLRVPIGQREAPRVTIPRLDPPAAEPRQNDKGEAENGETKRTWPASKEELEQLVREGLSNKEIADLYGVATVTVAARLQKLGIRRDPEALAKLRTRNGRKGREAGWKHHDVFFEKPGRLSNAREESPEAVVVQQDEKPAPSTDPAGDSDPLEEFAKYMAQVIRHAREMGLDVEVRLRFGGAA